MVFKPARSFNDPDQSQSGFATPGEGPQTTGEWVPPPEFVAPVTSRPTKGTLSWFNPARSQSGFPDPGNRAQLRPAGSMPNNPPQYGQNIEVYTPYYSRGAAAYVQNYGKVLTNPIGAGIVALHRPQASYGSSAQYANGQLFWTTQQIPTNINLQGLNDPAVLAAILGGLNVQAVVRTTG